jgi:two-component system, OmpR family, alkaline phosphatase synthesis response regulator PhoP
MKRILIIDDDDDILDVTQASLEIMRNWQVITANSGEVGLAKALSGQPDAILLDVVLADIDGVVVCQTLQNHPATRTIPVIFLTARVQPAHLKQLEALAVAAVLTKPFNPETLADQIAAILNWD